MTRNTCNQLVLIPVFFLASTDTPAEHIFNSVAVSAKGFDDVWIERQSFPWAEQSHGSTRDARGQQESSEGLGL
jgi:hypothetical protein